MKDSFATRLFKSSLDWGEEVMLECCPDPDILGTEEDKGHQAAGDTSAGQDLTPVRFGDSDRSCTSPHPDLSNVSMRADTTSKTFKTGFGQLKHWPRQKLE